MKAVRVMIILVAVFLAFETIVIDSRMPKEVTFDYVPVETDADISKVEWVDYQESRFESLQTEYELPAGNMTSGDEPIWGQIAPCGPEIMSTKILCYITLVKFDGPKVLKAYIPISFEYGDKWNIVKPMGTLDYYVTGYEIVADEKGTTFASITFTKSAAGSIATTSFEILVMVLSAFILIILSFAEVGVRSVAEVEVSRMRNVHEHTTD